MIKTHFSVEADTAHNVARDTEVESLRSEVRRLRAQIEQLETRLGTWDDNDADRWAIWPYGWIVLAWNAAQERFHSLQLSSSRRALRRHNARAHARSRRRHEFAAADGAPLRVV